MSATLLSGPTSRTGMNQHLDSIQCTSPAEMISDGTETAVVRRLPSRKRPHPLDRLHHPRLYIFFLLLAYPIFNSVSPVGWTASNARGGDGAANRSSIASGCHHTKPTVCRGDDRHA